MNSLRWFLCIAILSGLSLGQQKSGKPLPTIIRASFARQEEAPVRIVSMTKTVDNQTRAIVVRNVSQRQITSFQLAWVTVVPEGCPGTPTEPLVHEQAAENHPLAPGQEATLDWYRLPTDQLLNFAKLQEAKVLLTQVGVIRADFADGNSWKFDLPAAGIFDVEEMHYVSKTCTRGVSGFLCTRPKGNGSASLSPELRCWYGCVTAATHQYCSVGGEDSCTNHVCKNPDACPDQMCQLVCINPN
jgi:hypothetical protein